ncbi:predicted protein [Nematostella vectensis]|uniref:EF-hand domain-containing protein n=1 Tax=Nematostella vectensis TaxID=45351 RepID=A7SPM7_NEMVE|nr:calaxin [Nematostella vectensis]EDO34333.1 predicted protein [Nematostella vectensis]|eukprot:XP_001626433.1 predicted protein [Nematostella vectensis]
MASIIARKNQEKLAESIFRKTHFSKAEVINLLSLFSECANQKEKMDRNKFRDILHNKFGMTDDILMDRVFKAFDTNNDSSIDMDEWILGLSVFLRGTVEEQTKFCFDVYDLNSDAFISKEEIMHLLKNAIIKQPTEEDPDEGIRELCDIVLKLMDEDHDGRLSWGDFQKTVVREPLLLEAFGSCLPGLKCVENFSSEFKEKSTAGGPSVYKPQNKTVKT